MNPEKQDTSGRFDVTSLGSTMIRLSAPRGERLETVPYYQVRTAGSESNTMAALARMGRRTAWVSRLCGNALGRRVVNEIACHGVDTSRVVWTTEARNEVFFVEYGSAPRPTQVIYDRAHSAVSMLRAEEIDRGFLLGTRVLHLTGILPALSERCAQVARELIDAARSAGVTVSFDVNYRSRLWSPERAAETLEPLARGADLLFITREDAGDVFGIEGSPEGIVSGCRGRFGSRVVAVTLGGDGAIACDGEAIHRCAGYTVDVVDRLGAGDAFTAGVLCGWLEGSVQLGVEYGVAMAALKLGMHGDYFVSSREEVMMLLESGRRREIGR